MKKVYFLIVCVLMLSSCSINKQSLGIGRNDPDEFLVVNRQPLSVPPSYNLELPKPGTSNLNKVSSKDIAKSIVLGDKQNADFSLSDDGFLKEVGVEDTQDDIRKILEEEKFNNPANNKYLINKLMGWSYGDEPKIVDNMEEYKRIKKEGLNTNE